MIGFVDLALFRKPIESSDDWVQNFFFFFEISSRIRSYLVHDDRGLYPPRLITSDPSSPPDPHTIWLTQETFTVSRKGNPPGRNLAICSLTAVSAVTWDHMRDPFLVVENVEFVEEVGIEPTTMCQPGGKTAQHLEQRHTTTLLCPPQQEAFHMSTAYIHRMVTQHEHGNLLKS